MARILLASLLVLLPTLLVTAAAPVVDGHNHEGLSSADGVIDVSMLRDLRDRGIDVVVIPLPVDSSPTDDLRARIGQEMAWLREEASRGATFSLVHDPGKLVDGLPDNRTRLLFSIEWFRGSLFGREASSVKYYRDLGVRIIAFVSRDQDGLFEEGEPATLSAFGLEVLEALNENRVLIDITHLTHAQKLTVIGQSALPVIATHSLVQAAVPTNFNLPDEVLDALARRQGSVWVSFQKEDLLGNAEDDHAVPMLVEHVRVLVDRLGPDRVGIGTDLQAGGKYIPLSLNRADAFARIRAELEKSGFEPATIDGILGGNVLRVLAEFD
jgi:membrane dipeptidase